MATIEQLLHRRTDLSTFLVHLTRAGSGNTARENLLSIAADFVIEARTPMGPAAHLEEYLADTSATQKVVCFTETPLEHTWMMVEEIEGRAIQFEPYGLVFTKSTARRNHCNPVWYSDISTRGGRSWPIDAVNRMVADAVARASAGGTLDVSLLRNEPVFLVTPFFEQMGPTSTGGRKEFWWEREWRRIDNYHISFPSRVVAFLAPESDHAHLRHDLNSANDKWEKKNRPILDPTWGLERMIAELAGLDPEHVGPFPEA